MSPKLLYHTWGSAKVWYRQQPLPQIRDYFGDKVGLYFAWMGTYTISLIPAAVVGVLCFLYGVFSMDSTNNVVRYESFRLKVETCQVRLTAILIPTVMSCATPIWPIWPCVLCATTFAHIGNLENLASTPKSATCLIIMLLAFSPFLCQSGVKLFCYSSINDVITK